MYKKKHMNVISQKFYPHGNPASRQENGEEVWYLVGGAGGVGGEQGMSPSLLSKKGKVLKSKLFRFVSKCCQCLTRPWRRKYSQINMRVLFSWASDCSKKTCWWSIQSITECYKDKSSASILTNFWACFIDFHAQFLYLSTIVVILAVHLKKATSACIFSATFLLLLNGDERIRHRHQKSFSSQQLCLRCKRRTENKCVAATGNWIRICNRTILD